MAMAINFMIPSPNCYQFDVQGLTFYVQKEKLWNIEEKCIKHIFPYSDHSRPITVDNVSAKSFEHFLRLTHGGRARLTEANLIDLFILSVKYDAMYLYAKLHIVLSNTNTLNLPSPKAVRNGPGRSKENASPKKMIAQILKNWNQR
ncbi:hypothetical protein PRIPAC_97219 [Pristionchus pacificus]|uniref:Uncharacterized protein n=1 Tax=Pristionchus pacificus TaxID=54126 RepID=A0A2A6BD05_PRIPA|nr:hypothetical protein PRIPAC_97219 [Pristionchus pacificus]|eukprot:PDM63754.1 hypothetical protein PRIPAC_49727 [Pristionchus pacificus]